MKKIFRNLMMLLFALTAMVSCDESGDKIYLDGFAASSLMASSSDVALSVENSKAQVLSLAWQNPTLLSSDETKPAGNGTLLTNLQASATENFANVKEYTVTNISKSFMGGDLNALAKELGMTPDQKAPIYFRIKSQMGANLDAAYSNVCAVNVTPYSIDMSYINIWDKEKTKILTYLYSPNSDGIYAGYMNASNWMNFWGKENDGTVWGNSASDGTYVMSNEQGAWNFWYPDVAGIFYTVLNTQTKEMTATFIKEMQLNGEAMSYDAPNYAWTKVITTTADNTPISITGTGATYNKSTGDKGEPIAKTLNYTLADGKMTDASEAGSVNIPTAGTYTITVKVGENSQLTYSIESGIQEKDASNTLCMFTKDGSSLLVAMDKVSDGVYTCKYTPAAWEGFVFVYVGENKEDKQVWYGCEPSNDKMFNLSTADDKWSPWFLDDVNGEVTVTADLNTMTWKYE